MGPAMAKSVVFSAKVYSLETIKKAAYRFSDILSVDIIPRPPDIECVLHFLSAHTDDEAETIIAAFKNEVLDQDLRATIAKETEGVRNAILAYALSKTGLQSGE
jgi:His-Xaa-Ser system protein HxsD